MPLLVGLTVNVRLCEMMGQSPHISTATEGLNPFMGVLEHRHCITRASPFGTAT